MENCVFSLCPAAGSYNGRIMEETQRRTNKVICRNKKSPERNAHVQSVFGFIYIFYSLFLGLTNDASKKKLAKVEFYAICFNWSFACTLDQ